MLLSSQSSTVWTNSVLCWDEYGGHLYCFIITKPTRCESDLSRASFKSYESGPNCFVRFFALSNSSTSTAIFVIIATSSSPHINQQRMLDVFVTVRHSWSVLRWSEREIQATEE